MEDHNLNPELDRHRHLQQIGAKLRDIRMAKGISLEAVATQTLISQRLLLAIETGNLEELPEPFYTRALIEKYARAIGATKELDLGLIDDLTVEQSAVKTPTTNRKYLINFQLRSLHLYLLYILLVGISVKAITTFVERPVIVNETIPESQPSVDTAAKENDPSIHSNKSNSLPQFVSQSTKSDSVMVGINLQERCWLKVMVDGEVAFEGILPKGTQRTWTGKEQVTIRAGNAGGVTIAFNNGPQKILGEPGKVEEVTYTVN
jgi:cytoskeletal protein RodZ